MSGFILCVMAVAGSVLSFVSVAALWTLALALSAIFCGILGIILLRGHTGRREPLGMAGLAAAVIGIIIGAIKAIGWAYALIIR